MLLYLIDLKTFTLSKSETSELLEKMKLTWPSDLVPKVKSLKVFELEEGKRLLAADNAVVAVQIDSDMLLPFLGARKDILEHFPSVTVDMGAVKFVCNGANITRPGITHFESFKKGDIVLVKDETHGKVLAVGQAIEDSETVKAMSKGYIVENLHYISDKVWEYSKEI